MIDSTSERRLAENEVFFRGPNQQIVEGLLDLQKKAKAEGYSDLLVDEDYPIQFYCECSDEKCRKRIELTSKQYSDLHQNSSQFMVLPGHNIPELERVMQSTDRYMIVEKAMTPPKMAAKLNSTNLHHK